MEGEFGKIKDESPDYEKRIEVLEEEIRRKDRIIEGLKQHNEILLKTAMERAEAQMKTKLKVRKS